MELKLNYNSKTNTISSKKVLGKTNYFIGLTKICANCGKAIIGHPALSRKDNKTEICSNCATLEALEVFIKYNKEIIDIEKKIKNKMKETFTDEQMNLLEQYQNCEDKILQDMVEQAFVFGYVMSNELKYEATRYYNKK